MASGTLEVNGTSIVYDIPIHFTGAYENTMLKQDGAWKISKSVHTPMAKILVYHQVKDFAQWKSAFEAGQPMRSSAGELNVEFGTLHDDPNMVYVLTEWKSLEAFQHFFADPDLAKSMQAAGVTGKPTVMILDRK